MTGWRGEPRPTMVVVGWKPTLRLLDCVWIKAERVTPMITRLSLIGLALVFVLAGCETVDGIGQDVSGAARAVKRAL